jgi:hypothetical protein
MCDFHDSLPTKKVKSLALKYIAIPHEFKPYYPTPTEEAQCGSTTTGVDPTHSAADETTTTPDSNTGEPDQNAVRHTGKRKTAPGVPVPTKNKVGRPKSASMVPTPPSILTPAVPKVREQI